MIAEASAFFADWRKGFGPISQKEVDGINALLSEMEGLGWPDKRWWAYVLATAWHETAGTMQPIPEYGRGRNKPYGLPDAATGEVYYGRGFVQLTWRENYERLGRRLGLKLLEDPAIALDPRHAAAIMCVGMAEGLFTGKALGDYFDADTDDPINARRIVNGTDKAKLIAGYHEKALRAMTAGWGEPKPVDRISELEAEVASLRNDLAKVMAWAPTADAALDRLENRRA